MIAPWGTASARRTAEVIRSKIGAAAPDAAIILGSGLGRLADRITDRVAIPYHDVPGFPPPTVVGHSGAVIAGTLGDRRVVALSGREMALMPSPLAECPGSAYWTRRNRGSRLGMEPLPPC